MKSMYSEFEGSKYNTVPFGEMVPAIRNDLKALKSSKFTIKKHSFAGGQSFTVTLRETKLPIWSDNPIVDRYKESLEKRGSLNFQYQPAYHELFTDEFNQEMANAKSIALAYNRDASDPMSDYYSTNFYLHMEIELKK